jgi:hypothetical protein
MNELCPLSSVSWTCYKESILFIKRKAAVEHGVQRDRNKPPFDKKDSWFGKWLCSDSLLIVVKSAQ